MVSFLFLTSFSSLLIIPVLVYIKPCTTEVFKHDEQHYVPFIIRTDLLLVEIHTHQCSDSDSASFQLHALISWT